MITVYDGHGGTVSQMLTYNWSPLTAPTGTINTSNTTVALWDATHPQTGVTVIL